MILGLIIQALLVFFSRSNNSVMRLEWAICKGAEETRRVMPLTLNDDGEQFAFSQEPI
jgi:hypothetical protein